MNAHNTYIAYSITHKSTECQLLASEALLSIQCIQRDISAHQQSCRCEIHSHNKTTQTSAKVKSCKNYVPPCNAEISFIKFKPIL